MTEHPVDHFLHFLDHGYLSGTESTANRGETAAGEPGLESTPLRKRQLIDRIKGRAQELEARIEQLWNLL